MESTFLKIDGITQSCPECGGNLFHRSIENELNENEYCYICNGCTQAYYCEPLSSLNN